MKKLLLLPLFTCLLLAACKKEEILTPEEQFAKDIADIEAYIATNNLTVETTASGLHYIIEEEGAGDHPTITSEVSVTYKGYYLDGLVFDERKSPPVTFPLGQLIPGWVEGLQLFKKGGKGSLFLPSKLAYGSNPPAGIRKNAPMIFELELIDF